MIERLTWFAIGVYLGMRLGSPEIVIVPVDEFEDVPADSAEDAPEVWL